MQAERVSGNDVDRRDSQCRVVCDDLPHLDKEIQLSEVPRGVLDFDAVDAFYEIVEPRLNGDRCARSALGLEPVAETANGLDKKSA